MKKDVREWLETFLGGGSPFEADVQHILDNDDALRAEVRDLKARMRDERRRHLGGSSCEPFYQPERQCATCRATDLRVKNWRKP